MATVARQSVESARTVEPALVTEAKRPTNAGPTSVGALNSVATPALSLAGGVPKQQPKSLWERGKNWLGEKADQALEFSESLVWEMLAQFAPDLMPVIRQGPLEWLKEKISAAADSLVTTAMAPVYAIADVAQALRGHFGKLMEWMADAAARIAKGDCKPIAEAAEKIARVFDGFAAPVVDRLKATAERVQGFFSGLWERFGAPAWDFLKRVGGQAWEKIQQLGRWIWEKTAPIRAKLSSAWTWIKNKLGIGEGAEGQDGILQWVQGRAAKVWSEYVKPFIEKYKKPLLVAAGVLALLSPAGPVLAVGAAVTGLVKGIQWIRQRIAQRGSVVEDRGQLEGTILPAITGAVGKVSSFLNDKARSVTSALGKVVGGLGQVVGTVAGSLFRFAVGAFQWLMDRFQELLAWAQEVLEGLVGRVRSGLEALLAFVQPLFSFLKEIGRVAVDIMSFPAFIAGRLWKLIPTCIREPFVDFLINQVLRRVPLLKEIIEVVPKAWAKIKLTALNVIRLVFKQGDLSGALFEIFKLVLDALEIPLELVKSIVAKAGGAKAMILSNPLGFLSNMLAAVKQGFIQFGEKILGHLGKSIFDWFRGVLLSAGLTPPTDLSLKSVFEFTLQVLGITLEKILARVEEKVGKPAADRIRKVVTVMSKVWEWLSTLLQEGPAGIWKQLKGQLGDLWQGLLDGAIDWVVKTVSQVAMPRILAALGTAPVGAVVQAFIFLYNAIKTAAQYAVRVLQMISSVLDAITAIAKGAISGAANLVEQNLGSALTVAIGFLANYLGLGDLGKKIKEIVAGIQKKVEAAIDWLIEKAVRIGKAIIDGLTKAASSVVQWWKEKTGFTTPGGAKHELFFTGEEADAVPMIASHDPKPIEYKLKEFLELANAPKAAPKKKKLVRRIKDVQAMAKNLSKKPNTVNTVIAEMKTLFDVFEPQDTIKKFEVKKRETATLSGVNDTVGVHMIVDWLDAKNAGGGTPPKDSALKIVMNHLETDPNLKSPEKFVKGHLLNENLGGKGESDNLFPITGKANSQHLKSTEKIVKQWVLESTSPQWVWYEVKVNEIKPVFLVKGKKSSKNYVNCVFSCRAVLKDAAGNEIDSFVSAVTSEHNKPPEAEVFNMS